MSAGVRVLLAKFAMATRFEIVLYGDDEKYLKFAGEEALNEIERIESRISPFKPDSEISSVNQQASKYPVRVSVEVFNLLKTATDIWRNTDGAFDITVGELMKLWGFRGNCNQQPTIESVEKARERCGMAFVHLDEKNSTVQFLTNEVKIDLGAIGKGYAIDQALAVLNEAGIKSALIHGGTSTIAAIGTPPDEKSWKIAVELPPDKQSDFNGKIAVIDLINSSLSISAIWGRVKSLDKKSYGHIIDPRTGFPVNDNILSAISCKSATYSDALSTALLVAGKNITEKLVNIYEDLKYILITSEAEVEKPSAFFYGIEPISGLERFFKLITFSNRIKE